MDSKNKNILIGGLLAIVLIMAVGYAAFATQLNINGSATIDSTWNVHFDNSADKKATDATTTSGVVAVTKASTGQPSGTIDFTDPLNATVAAKLTSPGDSVVFTLTILNEGSFDATPSTPVLAWAKKSDGSTMTEGTIENQVAKSGHIQFTVSGPNGTLTKKTGDNPGTTTMTVTAEYVADTTTGAGESAPAITGNITDTEEAALTIAVVYSQA